MVDPVQILLRCGYWHSRVMGLLNFEVDWQTGRAVTTRRATIFAVVHNMGLIILTFSICPVVRSKGLTLTNARFLHEYFFLLTTVVRHLAVMLILINRWRHRSDILRFWNQLVRMVGERPNVFYLHHRRIILKCIFAFLADVMHTILDLSAQRKKLDLHLTLRIFVLYTLNTFFNLGVAQFYLAELQVLGLFELLKSDLEKLMMETETECLIRNRRGGCCFLADQLDILAKRHYKLKATLDEMSDLFKVQSLSMSMVYYLSAMGTIYFTFCSIWYNNTGFGSSLWGFLAIAISIALLIADNSISLNVGFLIQDQVKEINEKLAERTLFSQELDARLETVYENFQLQLACNPIEYYICGLFKVERGRIIGMINSAILSSILLVQWELSHFEQKQKRTL